MLERDGYELRMFAVDHGVSAVGYALVEEERPGRFDVDIADALGVPPGPSEERCSPGRKRHPRRARCPPARGARAPTTRREAVLAGDTAPFQEVVEAAAAADVLVHEATFLEDERKRAEETSHSTALDAAGVARDAGVELLALTHL